MSFDDALKAVLTASGNDAAWPSRASGRSADAGAGGVGRRRYACEAAFVEAMNAKAAELGLDELVLREPARPGLRRVRPRAVQLRGDVATCCGAAMEIDLVRASIGFSQADITVQRDGAPVTLALENTDALLEGYPGACAAKTGYTLAAGPCVGAGREPRRRARVLRRGAGVVLEAAAIRVLDSASAVATGAYANRSSPRPRAHCGRGHRGSGLGPSAWRSTVAWFSSRTPGHGAAGGRPRAGGLAGRRDGERGARRRRGAPGVSPRRRRGMGGRPRGRRGRVGPFLVGGRRDRRSSASSAASPERPPQPSLCLGW